MVTKVLVTGFEPFGGEQINPAQMVLSQLQSPIYNAKFVQAGVSLHTKVLPVVYRDCIEHCQHEIDLLKPDIVLMLGQAAGRDKISFEKVAINHDDYRIPDNQGNQPIDEPVVMEAPAAYFTTLPIKAMALHVSSAGIPAEISYSAGTFVCNHLFYGISHYLANFHEKKIRCDFVHIPLLPEQQQEPTQPSMPITDMVEGIFEAIICAASQRHDLKVTAGTIS
ncbi:pyroglutamyl-peptidase I [Photobacterium minamisatsumaniensis]|uniref:pyroglutamyl-peptidase I n=1 Tax=Photobacterium minamisatsumaniensis TaxID=2910233 RepID=UPI003D12F03C